MQPSLIIFDHLCMISQKHACVLTVCPGQVSERSLPPPPPQQPSLHDLVLAEIKQERKLRPVSPPSSRREGVSFSLCDVLSTPGWNL